MRRNVECWYQIFRWRLEMYGSEVGAVWARTQNEACARAREAFGPGSYTARALPDDAAKRAAKTDVDRAIAFGATYDRGEEVYFR
jgi:hypothetical protein